MLQIDTGKREKAKNNRNRGKKSENVKREKIVVEKLKVVTFSIIHRQRIQTEGFQGNLMITKVAAKTQLLNEFEPCERWKVLNFGMVPQKALL